MKASGLENKGCMLFTSYEAAIACQEYATSDRLGGNACSPSDVTVRCFKLKESIFATFFPIQNFMFLIPYWQHAGVRRAISKSIFHSTNTLHSPSSALVKQ